MFANNQLGKHEPQSYPQHSAVMCGDYEEEPSYVRLFICYWIRVYMIVSNLELQIIGGNIIVNIDSNHIRHNRNVKSKVNLSYCPFGKSKQLRKISKH